MQKDVVVNDTSIEGTLKYVTGYTGYSGDPTKQSGNFLALKCAATEGSTTTVALLGGEGTEVELDSDMNFVARITNKNTQKVKVTTTTAAGDTITKIFGLRMLKCESAS